MNTNTILRQGTQKLADSLDMIRGLGLVTPLNSYSWEEINSIAASGEAPNYFSIGDCKAITLNGSICGGLTLFNYEAYVYIIGFNHNGATNTIDFGTFKTALFRGTDICLIYNYGFLNRNDATLFKMSHGSSTNSGGWKGCNLRYSVLGSTNTNNGNATTTTATNPVSGTLMAALPYELRAVMKPMAIYTDNTGGGTDTASNVTSSVDYLPLLAEYEIFGSRTNANSEEQNYQEQYAYYSTGNSKVKYRHSAPDSTATWWERSPYCNNNEFFCGVYANGSTGYGTATVSLGLAPIFRV